MGLNVASSFMGTLKKEASKTFTENGAIGYSTTGHALIDFNFELPSFRKDSGRMLEALEKIVCEKDPYLLRYICYLRDCREGLGERETARLALRQLLENDLDISDREAMAVLELLPFYGRWDDLLAFIGTKFENAVLSIIEKQLEKDLYAMEKGENASLLAKWLPSDNASSKQSRYYAHKIAKFIGMPVRVYRSNLTALRKYLDVLEVKACTNDWAKIDYNKVPSLANLRYKDAFLRHDEERRKKYLEDLATGKSGVKINSSVNFPHDVVQKYYRPAGWHSCLKDYDESLEQLWKNLPDMPGLDDTLVIRDGSGSMQYTINKGAMTAQNVADALAIYCAARCKGEFKDTFITFSSKPEVVSLAEQESLHEKLHAIHTFDDCSNTNLEATFDLILRTAINGKMSQEDMPKQLLIISDMEFDGATNHYHCSDLEMATLMEVISANYRAHGYILPKLVFWNVNRRTNTIPMTENEAGIVLVSGFSVNILRLVARCDGNQYEALTKVLDSERYSQIPLAKYRE